jgi:hypothetical protein
MMGATWIRRTPSACLVAGLLLTAPLAAQDDGIVIDFGAARRPNATMAIPDSVLRRALAIFNAPPPATSRTFGGTTQVVARHGGNYGMFGGDLLVRSVIEGDVVVINGDLRITAEGRVTGAVIVLGGRYSADAGATVLGPVAEYRQRATVRRSPDGTLEIAEPTPSLRELAGQLALPLGPATLTPHIGLGTYNRVEGFPVALGGRVAVVDPTGLRFQLDGDLIVRTARDPAGTRDALGWTGRLTARLPGRDDLVFGLDAGSHIVATADQPFSDTESALSAFAFKRDYRDWYHSRDVGFTVGWAATPTLNLIGRIGVSRERSVAAVDAFSLLRSADTWRPNPLVDDGRYLRIELGALWDSRTEHQRPSNGWTVEANLRHNSSSDLTPIQLPVQVRDPLPPDGYGAWEGSFLVRREQRLNPVTTVRAQVMGRGWLGGDPLTIQRRLALAGGDGLPGYSFREIRCDPQRQLISAEPALCDRQVTAQVELRRTTGLRLGTTFGPYAVGIDRPDLVLFADLGSAWLAGDGPGQVPSNRIQAIGEWRADLGVGIDGGWLGAYLARSITDDRPVRAVFRLQQRF